jgi:hypothetical protein
VGWIEECRPADIEMRDAVVSETLSISQMPTGACLARCRCLTDKRGEPDLARRGSSRRAGLTERPATRVVAARLSPDARRVFALGGRNLKSTPATADPEIDSSVSWSRSNRIRSDVGRHDPRCAHCVSWDQSIEILGSRSSEFNRLEIPQARSPNCSAEGEGRRAEARREVRRFRRQSPGVLVRQVNITLIIRIRGSGQIPQTNRQVMGT